MDNECFDMHFNDDSHPYLQVLGGRVDLSSDCGTLHSSLSSYEGKGTDFLFKCKKGRIITICIIFSNIENATILLSNCLAH